VVVVVGLEFIKRQSGSVFLLLIFFECDILEDNKFHTKREI